MSDPQFTSTVTGKRPTAAAVAEALANLDRPTRTLPAAWWDQDAAEHMSQWIKRNRGNNQ